MAYAMPVMAALVRYVSIQAYTKLGPNGTAVFFIALVHPVPRKVALRIAYETIYHSTIYTWNMSSAVMRILYQELVVPATKHVISKGVPWYLSATRYGSASGVGVTAGVTFFAIAFPLAMATTDNASYGDLYTEEIAVYEHTALGQGGVGGGMMI